MYFKKYPRTSVTSVDDSSWCFVIFVVNEWASREKESEMFYRNEQVDEGQTDQGGADQGR